MAQRFESFTFRKYEYDMTPQEALKEIISSTPSNQLWYKVSKDEKEQTYLRVTALRILGGTAKMDTMVKFFARFGYNFKITVTKKIT